MKYGIISLFFVITILLYGCAEKDTTQVNDTETTEENETETAAVNEAVEMEEPTDEEVIEEGNDLDFLVDIEKAPQDSVGLINYKQGPYATYHVREDLVENDVLEDVRMLTPLPENASEEQVDAYFDYLYSLVAEDFPDPQDTLNKWEFGSYGDPDLPDSRFHFKENYNIEILLDSSGSMGFYAGDKTRMQVAKEAINQFVMNAPKEANVSLRVYGHEGTGDDSDKALSCETIEQVYGFAPYNEAEFQDALNQFEPAGWTPLAAAMEASNESMKALDSEANTNLIYIVSDGIETCDGDPVKVAEQLSASNAKPIINVIGFQTDAEAQAQLEEIARVADGIYASANNQEELQAEFERAEATLAAWEDWKKDAMQDVKAMKNHNHFDIMAVSNEWHRLQLNLMNNLFYIINTLQDEGIINGDQKDKFMERRSAIETLIDQTEIEVKENLKNISVDSLEEMEKEINEKYDENSQE